MKPTTYYVDYEDAELIESDIRRLSRELDNTTSRKDRLRIVMQQITYRDVIVTIQNTQAYKMGSED